MVFAKRKLNGNFSTNPNCMDDLYMFHDELGSGGFGKVKLATHVLSGEKVAVKIIDKKAIGDDLPRVTTELEALKNLAHQNICRMFQYVETDEKFYIVMEYCNGGEMFDYIVRKERLEESEARHFFRQLVQAIAYVHSLGFAHRDLKPENLLLKEDLQLKVIDFGLCAKPKNGLSRPLETCCGSPAYAAPELIQNSAYYGNEADIWSMGVLLYALLCGALPFEDESMPKLYRKIMQGVYHKPSFLTEESKKLLSSMLDTNPRRRITIKELLVHPWLNKNYHQPLKYTTIYDKSIIDEEVAHELAFFYSIPMPQMVNLLKEWRFDYVTATYLVLLQKKERKQKFTLPYFRGATQNAICSPTIHASLEMDLHRSGVEATDSQPTHHEFEKPMMPAREFEDRNICESPFEKSYAKAIDCGSPLYIPSPQHQIQKIYCRTNPNPAVVNKELTTPRKKSADQMLPPRQPHHHSVIDNRGASLNQNSLDLTNKENQRPATLRPATMNNKALAAAAIANFVEYRDENGRPKSVYSTPRRTPIAGVFSPALYRRPKSVDREPTVPYFELPSPAASPSINAHPTTQPSQTANDGIASHAKGGSASAEHIPIEIGEEPLVPSANGRMPRSEVKTPRLRQRVFKSLERKADKMINLLTPRKMRHDSGPTKLKRIKTMVNVSVTSSTDPNKIRDELVRVLHEQGIVPVQNGWKISGAKQNANGMGQTTVELEVVLIDNIDYVGVKRRRLNGDAFLYKKFARLKNAHRKQNSMIAAGGENAAISGSLESEESSCAANNVSTRVSWISRLRDVLHIGETSKTRMRCDSECSTCHSIGSEDKSDLEEDGVMSCGGYQAEDEHSCTNRCKCIPAAEHNDAEAVSDLSEAVHVVDSFSISERPRRRYFPPCRTDVSTTSSECESTSTKSTTVSTETTSGDEDATIESTNSTRLSSSQSSVNTSSSTRLTPADTEKAHVDKDSLFNTTEKNTALFDEKIVANVVETMVRRVELMQDLPDASARSSTTSAYITGATDTISNYECYESQSEC